MRIVSVLIVTFFWPATGIGQQPEITELEPIGNWYRNLELDPLYDKTICIVFLMNESGARLHLINNYPDFLAELPGKFLSSGSKYRYDKDSAERVTETHDNALVIIPLRLDSAKSLLIAFDVKGERYQYETFDLADGQDVVDWLNSPECTGE